MSLSQSRRIILACLIAALPHLKKKKKAPIVSVCVCVFAGGLTEDPSHLGTGGCVTSPPCLHPPLPPSLYFGASVQSEPREPRSRENPPSLGYHDNEHWSRQHLAVVVRKEEGKEGGRRGRERRGKKGGRKTDKRTNPRARGIPFWIISLLSVCPQYSEYLTFIILLHQPHHMRMNGNSMPSIVILCLII